MRFLVLFTYALGLALFGCKPATELTPGPRPTPIEAPSSQNAVLGAKDPVLRAAAPQPPVVQAAPMPPSNIEAAKEAPKVTSMLPKAKPTAHVKPRFTEKKAYAKAYKNAAKADKLLGRHAFKTSATDK